MSGDKYKIANQQHPYFFQMFNFSVTNAFFKRPRYKRGRGGELQKVKEIDSKMFPLIELALEDVQQAWKE